MEKLETSVSESNGELRCLGWCHDVSIEQMELRCLGWCHDLSEASYSGAPLYEQQYFN